MKKMFRILGNIILIIIVLVVIYILTLCFPQPFFKNKVTVGNITVYSDEEIPTEINEIVKTAESRIKKSVIYRNEKQRIFIANNPNRWNYFLNVNHNAGAISYVYFINNIFLRKVDIKNNRLYGPSGKAAAGDRTLDYFMTHEVTHRLEFESRPWYKYSTKENWIQEGYSEYIGHDSQNYESALKYYLEVPENSGAKRYTQLRVMVTYLLENEKINIADIWDKTNDYNAILKLAIPDDKPNIVN
ncbi:MAG: hypothetical protein PHE32_00380 [Candidatus Shapirobacteria bacterium]|nr:hypothetical protein [Candidatus Shapirobacteria bacterium]MDD4410153.1 hypothetical protein [Candidatus Shapirobacteria bacterium]